MKEQIKPSVKDLYDSLHAPEYLREKTLAAVKENGADKKKARILEINFKALGALAACLVLCFGLLFWGNFGGSDMNISVGGNNITADAVICRSVGVNYFPEALPLSAKTTGGISKGDALKLDVDFDGKVELEVSGAIPAVENAQGQICEISQKAEIDGGSALYVIMTGAEEIQVTFTAETEVKTLIITENSDGTYTVGIK